MSEHHWRLVIDRGEGLDTLIVETTDLEGLYRRIGQMVMSLDIEQVAVYRDDIEYRRYALQAQDEGKKTKEECMMHDAIQEIRELAQSFSFDHSGRLIVKVERDE